MEKIKNFLVTVAEHKIIFFVKGFIITFVLVLLTTFIMLLQFDDHERSFNTFSCFYNSFLGIYGLFFIIYAAMLAIIRHKITFFGKHPGYLILIHQSWTSGYWYDSPIWGKPTYTMIKLPRDWEDKEEKQLIRRLSLDFTFNAHDKDGKELKVLLPTNVSFQFDPYRDKGDFLKANEIEEMLLSFKDRPQYFNLERYLGEDIVKKNSKNEKLIGIEQAASDWIAGKKSAKHLSVIVENYLSYIAPFSNVSRTTISVGLPKTYVSTQ